MAPRKKNTEDVPSGEVKDNSYVTSGDTKANPVVSDDAPVDDPIDDETADTDAQLGKLYLQPFFISTIFIENVASLLT